MYSLSVNAINQYRKGAKRGADIPVDILKIKLNCLCQAGREINTYNGKQYDFGSCVIEVKNNIITKIYWDDKRNPNVPQWRGTKLRKLFNSHGLDKTGNDWIVKETLLN